MLIYLLLIPIFFANMVYGIVGFGNALLMIPFLAPIIGVREAVIFSNLWGIFPAVLNFIKYRKYLDKSYFYRFLSLGLPATILGTLMILSIQTDWIKLVFGIFVFVYSSIKLVQYYKQRGKSQEEETVLLSSKSPWIYVGGFSYGLLTGLISAAGPINVAFLERSGHYRESLIGNFGAIGTVLSFPRIPFYFIEGVFPWEYLLFFFIAFPVIFIGTLLGHKITPKIPVKLFQIIIFIFLLIISVNTIVNAIIGLTASF